MRKFLAHACKHTFQQIGSWPGLLWVVGLPILALAAHLFLFGERAVLSQVPPLVSLFAAFGFAVFVLFVGNLAATPYRMEKEKNNDLQASVASLAAENSQLKEQNAAENPVRVDPTTGATVIGKRAGPLTLIGGTFRGGLRIGDENEEK